jgi:hypothetical protein
MKQHTLSCWIFDHNCHFQQHTLSCWIIIIQYLSSPCYLYDLVCQTSWCALLCCYYANHLCMLNSLTSWWLPFLFLNSWFLGINMIRVTSDFLCILDISLKFMYSFLVTEFPIFGKKWYSYTLELTWLFAWKKLSYLWCFVA